MAKLEKQMENLAKDHPTETTMKVDDRGYYGYGMF